VLLELRHRWADGTSHLLFDPVELLERLAALTPRPRINLVLYYGVLGAHAAWRARLRQLRDGSQAPVRQTDPRVSATSAASPRSKTNLLWAQLMHRSFGFDVLECERCGGRLRLIALIDAPDVVGRILRHLGLPAEVPAGRPARAPPLGGAAADDVEAP
jgi:hypothetical protein